MKEIIKKMASDSKKALLTSSYNRVKPAATKAAPANKPSDSKK